MAEALRHTRLSPSFRLYPELDSAHDADSFTPCLEPLECFFGSTFKYVVFFYSLNSLDMIFQSYYMIVWINVLSCSCPTTNVTWSNQSNHEKYV